MNRAVMSTINIIILIVFLAATAGHAQVSIDVSKITCDQYLAFKVADPKDIGVWLSGYYHGKQGNTDVQSCRPRRAGCWLLRPQSSASTAHSRRQLLAKAIAASRVAGGRHGLGDPHSAVITSYADHPLG